MLSDCCPVLSVCLHAPSVCNVGVFWPNGWMDQDETWHAGRPQPWPHCVRWDPAHLPQSAQPHQFSAPICCGQMAGWIKMPLGMKTGLDLSDIVRWGPTSSKKRQSPPQFSAVSIVPKRLDGSRCHLAWSLDPGHTALDGDPAPLLQKGGTAPNFRPMSIAPKWLDGSTCPWYGGRPRPRPHCARWGPSCPPRKGGTAPNFRPMFVVAKRLDGSRCQLIR